MAQSSADELLRDLELLGEIIQRMQAGIPLTADQDKFLAEGGAL